MPPLDQVNEIIASLEDALLSKNPAPPPPQLAERSDFVRLYEALAQLRQFALALAGGDLSQPLQVKGELAGALKSLQANLRHLTWQTQQIAEGDFTQRVDFMGEFSTAFNTMTVRLDQARDELQGLKEFNESIFENMAEGITVDSADGKIIFVNRAAADMLGYMPKQILGRHWDEFFPPDQIAVIQAANQRRLAGLSDRYETQFIDRNGTRRDVLISGAPRFEQTQFVGTIAVFTDITKLKQTEQAMRESESLYRLLAENSTDVIWTIDFDGKFLYVSPSVQALRGYTPEEIIGQPIEQAICPGSLSVVMQRMALALEEVRTGKPAPIQPFQVEQPCKDGSTVWTEVIGRVMYNDANKPIGILGITRNITERRKLEQEKQQLFEETQRLAILDPLTGVFNRREFDEYVMKEIERASRHRRPFSLLMLDIDHFKRVNDTYGHPVGDKVLQHLAQVCQKNLRGMDIIGRYGGEEFLILLSETVGSQAAAIAERLRQEIAQIRIETGNEQVQITASLGVVNLNDLPVSQVNSPEEREALLRKLIAHADQALYVAKTSGRNQVSVFK